MQRPLLICWIAEERTQKLARGGGKTMCTSQLPLGPIIVNCRLTPTSLSRQMSAKAQALRKLVAKDTLSCLLA